MNRKLNVEELNRPDLEAFKAMEKLPVTVVLDNIRSFHNVGSIFRTADAFRFNKVVLCGITPQPPHREISKTALGATESVEWSYEKDSFNVINEFRSQGHVIVALEQTESSTLLQDFQLELDENQSVVIVLGNEVFGVSQEVIEACNLVVEIPQEGTKHSLNVSVSAGMLMWEVFKKLRY